MNFLNGITLLLVYQLAGEFSVLLLDIPIPGPVLGMVMLFITLALRGETPDSLDSAATGLLSHLSLLFVPAGVGIMAHFDRLAGAWLPVAATLLLSTVITMGAVALIMLGASRLLGRGGAKDG